MDSKTMAFLNILALALLYVGFIPYHNQLAQLLILVVALLLFVQKR